MIESCLGSVLACDVTLVRVWSGVVVVVLMVDEVEAVTGVVVTHFF